MLTSSRRRLTLRSLLLACLGGCLMLGTEAFGQSLSDRIDQVMRQRATAQRSNKTKAGMLGTLLYTDLTVQFTETPAREALNYLKTTLGVNIVARFNDDRTGVGIDPDQPITLDVVDKPALTVLEMVLDQCGDEFESSTWQLRNGFVEVGTKDRLGAKSAQEIRFYPVRDLMFEPPNYDNAPSLDLNSALNQSQNSGGGGGGGSGGGGFGGGSGGGGSGGGGSGGGGGSIFDDPGDDPDRLTEIEKAEQLIDLITEIVEPDGWVENGGEFATIRYYQGTLIIRAPDFIHRQIGGYPFAIRGTGAQSVSTVDRRYVTFSTGFSSVEVTGTETATFTGAAGGAP